MTSEPFETIVVVSGHDRTAAIVREQFPQVQLIELEKPALPGEARNAGLRVARGKYVSFPGSHVELPPGSLQARLRAHRSGYAMVTGVAENGTDTPAGWASYFLDHAQGLPGQKTAEIAGPPAHCSYARAPLLEAGGFPEGVRTAEDTAVNRELVRRGYVALREPAIRFVHRSRCVRKRDLIRHHFRRGRGWGWLLLEQRRVEGRLLTRDLVKERLIEHLPNRMLTIELGVAKAEPVLQERYKTVRRLTLFGAVSSWMGMWFELLKPARGKWLILRGRPVLRLAVRSRSDARLTTIDFVDREIRTSAIPGDLPLRLPDGALVSLQTALAGEERMPGEWRDLLGHALDRDLDGVVMVDGEPSLSSPIQRSTLRADRLKSLLKKIRRFPTVSESLNAAPASSSPMINAQSGRPDTFWP